MGQCLTCVSEICEASVTEQRAKCNCEYQFATYYFEIDITKEERKMDHDVLLNRVIDEQKIPPEWKKYWFCTNDTVICFRGCHSCVGRDIVAKKRFQCYAKGWKETIYCSSRNPLQFSSRFIRIY
jgi:hypothetical protein